jgi:hypothetical protein
MAIILNKPSQFGVDATYWKIAPLSLNNGGSSIAHVSGYASKSARDANASPLMSLVCPIEYDITVSGEPYVQAYEKLKALDEFAGATDEI